jgi:hypothetical protein
MHKRNGIALVLVLAATLAAMFLNIPVASSQGATLVGSYVTDPLPTQDLNSPLWQKATPPSGHRARAAPDERQERDGTCAIQRFAARHSG